MQVKRMASSMRVGSLTLRTETAQQQSQPLHSHQEVAVTQDCSSERPGASLPSTQTPAMSPSRPATCRAAP